MRAAVRPDDAGGAVCSGKHCRWQLAAFHVARDGDEAEDVARASLAELANDYLNWLLLHGQAPWSIRSQEYAVVNGIQLDGPTYRDDVQHLSSLHILAQKRKLDAWLGGEDSLLAANCLLVLCNRLIQMLHRQIEHLLDEFKEEGGFTEGLTAERLAHRAEQSRAGKLTRLPAPSAASL